MAFKIVEDAFGQLTFMRIYQGKVKKGEMLLQPAHRQEGPLQPHREDARRQDARKSTRPRPATSSPSWASTAPAATPTASEPKYCTLENMFVAEPVIKMSITPRQPRRRRQAGQGPAAVPQGRPDVPGHHRRRDQRDDHRRHGRAAPGDLRRADPPRVQGRVRRSAPRRSATAKRRRKTTPFNFKHKKQTGGSGQYAHIVGMLEPMTDRRARDRSSSRTRSTAAAFPREFIPSVEKGFRDCSTRARSPASRSSASR